MTASAKPEQPAYPIGSVDKALRLLTIVAANPGGIRIGDASRVLGVAPSTAHRLLQMLALHGFASQDPATKTYRPGEAIRRLVNPRERVRQLARPVLGELVDEFKETVHLAALEGNVALTLLSVESPHMLRVGNREGHAQPAHLSAMGRVLLSGLDADELGELIGGSGAAVDARLLATHLESIRTCGFIVQHGEVEPGVSALAVPVRGPGDTVDYAIGVTFPTSRVASAELPHLAEATQRAGAALEGELRR